MTKASPILITKRASLAGMPEPQRATVRHVLLDAVGGLDSTHDSRWRRFINRLLCAEPGEVFELASVVERSGQFHRRHMALEQRLFDHQERWLTLTAMRDWLKTGAGWVEWLPGPRGGIVAVPRSTSYESCSDDEMREVHEAMVAFLHTPHAQRMLWPHLAAAGRAAMLESVLASPQEEA
ncbi:MAG: hypothetical protein WA955_15700 [Diaphorobacter nitroreducens]|uniref:hypothetical protein n=1 Tax=Diaphorobacter nitroreducens TaxID=164759 RepID=UPI003C790AC2